MDIEVDGARMIRMRFEHAFQQSDDLARASLRRFASCGASFPIVPGLGVHQGLCRKSADLGIIRILRRQFGHGLAICGIERRAISIGRLPNSVEKAPR